MTAPTCTLTNQEVYLAESGLAAPSGSYGFTALIGSVLNGGVQLGSPQVTKYLNGAGQYTYSETNPVYITASPAPSPYSAAGYVPIVNTPTSNNNGGGLSFSSFTSSSQDNLLEISNTQLPSLLNNAGSNGETEHIWLTGFPVFDQASGVNQFQFETAGGAYQVVFSTPVQTKPTAAEFTQGKTGPDINVPITLLGQSWVILNASPSSNGGAQTVTSTANAVAGGKISLAASLSPLQTVYVGQNVTSGPFTVQLQDLGQPNSNGISNAALAVYYKGVLTNETQASPPSLVTVNVSGSKLFVKVNSTFAGLYAYQKWAKIQLFANIFNLTNGKVFNQTNDPGWNVNLLWTNTTTASGNAVALQSIIIYNASPVSLSPGQSFTFLRNPAAYKVTFVGDTLGSNYDAVTASTTFTGSVEYCEQPVGSWIWSG